MNFIIALMVGVLVFTSSQTFAREDNSITWQTSSAQTDSNLKSALEDIKRAIESDNINIIASITSKAIAENQNYIKEILQFIVQEKPDASVEIMKAIQQRTPKLVNIALNEISEQLSKLNTPKSAQLIAQVLAASAPAAGNTNANNNQGQRNNQEQLRLSFQPPIPQRVIAAVIENPSQNSPSQ